MTRVLKRSTFGWRSYSPRESEPERKETQLSVPKAIRANLPQYDARFAPDRYEMDELPLRSH